MKPLDWNLTKDEWLTLSRCNRVACQLFSRDRDAADEFARMAYSKWALEGIPPEKLRDRRAPRLSDRVRLRKWKQTRDKDLFPGT